VHHQVHQIISIHDKYDHFYDLVNEGKNPRAMLEYSGTLLHGMRKMGLHDVFDL
jgi:hypothetical protein